MKKSLTPMQYARFTARLTQLDLAEKTGLNEGIIVKIETNRRQPLPSEAKRIADALGLPVEALFPDLNVTF